MDVLPLNGLRQLIAVLDNFDLDDNPASHIDTPEQTEERGRKSHIPTVTTVPREDRAPSGDRQARRRPIAVLDEKEETPGSSPAATNETTTEAEAGQIHDTPNRGRLAIGRPFISGRRRGHQGRPQSGGGHDCSVKD